MAVDRPILINGKSFSYTDITINILGVPVQGIEAISYDEEQTTEGYYGTSDKPVSVGSGEITSNGSLTVSMNEIEALRDVAPNGKLLRLPLFDIKVTYINDGQTVTHSLKRCKFTSDGGGGATGDTTLAREYPLFIADIDYRA